MVAGSRTVNLLNSSEVACLVFRIRRLLECDMLITGLWIGASDLKQICYAMRHVAKWLTETPYWQIIEKYWNTTIQQNNIWSIAFVAQTKEIMIEVWQRNGPYWLFHNETGTRPEHSSMPYITSQFNLKWVTYQNCVRSTALTLMQTIWNSLIAFQEVLSTLCLLLSVWMVVYVVQIQPKDCQQWVTNGQHPLDCVAEAIRGIISTKYYHLVNDHGRYTEGFYSSMTLVMDDHIPLRLITFTWTAMHHALLE